MNIFTANIAENESIYISTGRLAKFYMEQQDFNITSWTGQEFARENDWKDGISWF